MVGVCVIKFLMDIQYFKLRCWVQKCWPTESSIKLYVYIPSTRQQNQLNLVQILWDAKLVYFYQKEGSNPSTENWFIFDCTLKSLRKMYRLGIIRVFKKNTQDQNKNVARLSSMFHNWFMEAADRKTRCDGGLKFQ